MTADAADADELERILAGDLITPRFQPIVDLEDDSVVAYEALARGPEASPLHRPDRLFAVAAKVGRLDELDRACRRAAVRAGADGGLTAPLRLFVNAEPNTLAAAGASLPAADAVVVELTERALVDRPAGVIAAVAQLRAQGVGIALDDVGADRRSLAFMPFVAPDVIKLDLRLVQGNPTAEIAAIVHAVNAEAERSGAIVLAEGIETEEHRRVALALGATHGQGWLFGRPEALPASFAVPARPLPTRRAVAPAPAGETPFGLISAERPTRRGPKRLLLAISKHLEAQAMAHGEAAVVLATFQEARHLTDASRSRYRRLAQSAAFVGAFGVGLPDEPIPGVRGAGLDRAEPLRGEWNVVVVTPHFAAAFVGRDLGDRGRRHGAPLRLLPDLRPGAGRARGGGADAPHRASLNHPSRTSSVPSGYDVARRRVHRRHLKYGPAGGAFPADPPAGRVPPPGARGRRPRRRSPGGHPRPATAAAGHARGDGRDPARAAAP